MGSDGPAAQQLALVRPGHRQEGHAPQSTSRQMSGLGTCKDGPDDIGREIGEPGHALEMAVC